MEESELVESLEMSEASKDSRGQEPEGKEEREGAEYDSGSVRSEKVDQGAALKFGGEGRG